MSLKLGVIVVSIREGRIGKTIADWVYQMYNEIKDDNVSVELVDL